MLESVGNIKFGMTKQEVREKYAVKGEFIKNDCSNNLTDDLGFCHVYYNDEGKCEAVEIMMWKNILERNYNSQQHMLWQKMLKNHLNRTTKE